MHYGFLVRLGYPAGALLCPLALALVHGGVVWLHCSCGWSAEQVGLLAKSFAEGTARSFNGEPHSTVGGVA